MNSMKTRTELNNKGFSLVELIIVIAIMAILVGVVGTQVIPYMENSKQAKDIQILSSYATAGVMAYASHPDCAPADDMTITITSSAGGDVFTCDVADAQEIADELKNLIGKDNVTNVSTTFESKKFKKIVYLEVYYDYTNRDIKVYAYDSAGALINNDQNVFGRL